MLVGVVPVLVVPVLVVPVLVVPVSVVPVSVVPVLVVPVLVPVPDDVPEVFPDVPVPDPEFAKAWLANAPKKE